MVSIRYCALVLCLWPVARAEVLEATAGGFRIQVVREVTAAPALSYDQFLAVAEWWDPAHTYFGRAENLSIEPEPGGCFCERDGGRAVLHMTVSYIDPGAELRMLGGLGPLQGMGLHGAMVWRFEPLPDGGTRIVHDYRVGGYAPGGLRAMAAAVDRVQSGQVDRLAARLAGEL